jgi:pantoate--beta-alanine ligase
LDVAGELIVNAAVPPPQVISDREAMRAVVESARREGRRVGIVPTMGALHAGHLSLVEAARRECDVTVVTIFVNPTQFGPGEDFSRYPRTLDHDIASLVDSAAAQANSGAAQTASGATIVFAPAVESMYRPGAATLVDVGRIAQRWEGQHRPGHFRGVATIVLKLLHLIPAHVAYFGRKDYQQALAIRRMVDDLDVPIEVRVCPTPTVWR